MNSIGGSQAGSPNRKSARSQYSNSHSPSRSMRGGDEEGHEKAHHLMPRPSPRKWMKSREMSESPEREKSKYEENQSVVEEKH